MLPRKVSKRVGHQGQHGRQIVASVAAHHRVFNQMGVHQISLDVGWRDVLPPEVINRSFLRPVMMR